MNRRGSILLADDEEKILTPLRRALEREGYDVVATTSGREARRFLNERIFDVLVVDNVMPDLSGLDLIREATKPFEVDELMVVVEHAVEHQRLRTQHRYLISEREEEFDHYGIVGRSRVIQDVIRQAERVAESKSTVLVMGETGTGKELLARAIHDRSPQRHMPLIKVNCAAIPDTLLESELFGHVRGAFTGANTCKKGKFALADGGTIFLDEIGTMSPSLQAKLLRVLQEREFEPLGAERSQKVDVRVIAATNRDIKRLVEDGRFLEDLYYRLNVIPLVLPPLRERREDVAGLVEHFLRKHAQRSGRRVTEIREDALQRLMAYDWPGNVRELENTIERAVVLSRGPVIEADDITMPGIAGTSSAGLPSLQLRSNVEWAERQSVQQALVRAGGVKKDAAALLGISQRALSYYLAKYRVE
ncbi:MAG: hypothetical protein DMF78_13475 [Acidobacteria bacterium]|nr:MAG: hypothetical protein DMF78_13475 [Acidobacteriota bacterium]